MEIPEASYFINGILKDDVVVLSRAITLVESVNKQHQVLAQQIIDGIIHKTGNSFRLGITGVPGVGKSSFIEKFGKEVLSHQHKLAVLAIDPSSVKSKGSILGDKTRMTELSVLPGVYIRPSPNSGTLGGVTRATYESILLCEAAGYDFIIVETVGVGQSEVTVSKITDFFLLLMLAGAGDELQGIKRGIMEMADALVITKADGDNLDKAKAACSEFSQAMHLFQLPESGWNTRALISSSITELGIKEVYAMVLNYKDHTQTNGYFTSRRKQQRFDLFLSSMDEQLKDKLYADPKVRKKILEIKELDPDYFIQPFALAHQIVSDYLKEKQ